MASIKTRVGHSHLGGMSNKELKKLFDSALFDLAAIRTQVNALRADLVKVNCNTAAANNTVSITAVDVAALTLTA